MAQVLCFEVSEKVYIFPSASTVVFEPGKVTINGKEISIAFGATIRVEIKPAAEVRVDAADSEL